jgi:sulfur-carrier protein
MAVEVRVTAVLQKLVGGAKVVPSEGDTVGQVLDHIDDQHPGFLSQVTQGDGQLHRFVNIYLNDEDIRYLKQLETPVKEGDVLSILPALAGGSGTDVCPSLLCGSTA